MTKTNQNFHRWYPWPKRLKKKKKLTVGNRGQTWPRKTKVSPLVTLAKNSQDHFFENGSEIRMGSVFV